MTDTEQPATALPKGVDLAELCVQFASRLASAGLSVPAERSAWWAESVLTATPTLVGDLYWLGRVTLVDRSEKLATYDRVFSRVFDAAPAEGDRTDKGPAEDGPSDGKPAEDQYEHPPREEPGGPDQARHDQHSGSADGNREVAPAARSFASDIELLRNKDFADCSAEELAELAKLVGRMRLVAPVRPSGWRPSRRSGRVIDLRRTLRDARRTGGDPINLRHRHRGTIDRQLVLLADVSGSMQDYSRMYLRVLQGAVVGARAHAYVFATQLRPVTRALGRGRREDAIRRALATAPDAAGGTRIGAAVKEFLDTDGRRGLARGAVVVIVSDG
ncbi:MAG: VWA domain-containing protein, partial [Nakamurella sp.]